MLAAAMDGVVSPRIAGLVGKLGGLAVLNLEGIWTRYEDADAQLERISKLPPEQATREMQKIYSEPVKPELVAQRVREIKAEGVVCLRLAHPAAGARLLRARARGGPRRDGDPGHGDLRRARLLVRGAAQPEGVHRRASDPVHRRRLRELLDRPAPDAHRRGRRAGRRRPRRGLHDARRARHRRPAGDCDRRRPGRPLAAHARDRHVRERDRRRRHAQRRRHRQGVRVRRGRGDDRLPAGPRARGARPRLPLGHGDIPLLAARAARASRPSRTARSRRSCSAPRTRTTAPSTSSARCGPRWRRAATRTSRPSTAPR